MNKSDRHILKKVFSLENIFIFIIIIAALQGLLFDLTVNLRHEYMLSNILFFFILYFMNNKYVPLAVLLYSVIITLTNGLGAVTIIQVMEISLVSIMHVKLNRSILISDLLFWVIAGTPLSLLLVYLNQDKVTIYSFYYLIITASYRLFNALVVDAAITYISWQKPFNKASVQNIKISFTTILIHLCFASIVIPVSLFFVVNNYSIKESIKEASYVELNNAADYIKENLKPWTEDNWINLYLNNPVQQFKMQRILDSYDNGKNQTLSFEIFSGDNLIFSNKNNASNVSLPANWRNFGKSSEISQNFYLWTPSEKRTYIGSSNWLKSFYIYEIDVSGYKISINIPLSVYSNRVFNAAINLLKIMLLLSVLIAFFGILIKKVIFDSIYRLTGITNDLPEKLKNHEQINLEKSKIYEINSLINNFQSMANNLSVMITNFESVNEKLKESQELLIKQANYDFLTNLPNRNYFNTHAKRLMDEFNNKSTLSNVTGIAFLLIDLDRFKQVNDNFGHAVGDKLLQEVSKRMDETLKQYFYSDGFAARLGGDEFVIVLTYNDINLVYEIVQLLQARINEPVKIDEYEAQVGSSIGVSLYPQDGEDLESILKNADHSMYYAKEIGGNRFYHL